MKVSITYQQKRKKIGIENVKSAKTFIGFSQAIGDVYENLKY